ncbi:MAG: metallophosphoesterase family protein [Elainellaceae cyanobacterium]
MDRYSNGRILVIGIGLLLAIALIIAAITNWVAQSFMSSPPRLLTDPFLQYPTQDTVHVVWFTEFAGARHYVTYGERFRQKAIATTTKLSRTREDQKSRVGDQTEDGQIYQQPVMRDIWRHEADVTNLAADTRVPYRVMSVRENGEYVGSDRFTLAPSPSPGTPLKILLTSDHQSKDMTPANLQKVVETVGQVDAVFQAGDLVNIPDRASEWFDDNEGKAFFPCLQGRTNFQLGPDGQTTTYKGGAIIQYAPLFSAIGNHEVMGRFSMEKGLGEQFNDPIPRNVADQLYSQNAKQINPQNDPKIRAAWIKDHSFNVDTYREIFTLPQSPTGGSKYYAVSFGDIRLVVLYATNIWRVPGLGPNDRGRYREKDEHLADPEQWGYGQHIFEAIAPGSPQYQWLVSELNSPESQQATYKVVMFHHPAHSIGDNVVPAYTDPIQFIDRFPDDTIKAVRYEYPLDADYLARDVLPLLEQAGVNLVFYGHDHIWNRFVSPSGTHYLESSNVGNTYGAFLNGKRRNIPIGYQETYVPNGDPNGLDPVMPTLEPLLDDAGEPMPYLASDDITAFSILETKTGTVSSYRFDTRDPDSPVIKFDEFSLR